MQDLYNIDKVSDQDEENQEEDVRSWTTEQFIEKARNKLNLPKFAKPVEDGNISRIKAAKYTPINKSRGIVARILDYHTLMASCIDYADALDEVDNTLKTAFPKSYADSFAQQSLGMSELISTSMGNLTIFDKITDNSKYTIDPDYWRPDYHNSTLADIVENDVHSNNVNISYSNSVHSDMVMATITPREIKPWYTMVAVLWNAARDKVCGFRLYDWLLNTTADYTADSVRDQVKAKTVKVTNLDYLIDSLTADTAKTGLRCTQGTFEDYTALDASGKPLDIYRPLVILGYSPVTIKASATSADIVLVDYKGNIIYAGVSRFGTTWESKAFVKKARYSDHDRPYLPDVSYLALTRGIANAVISATCVALRPAHKKDKGGNLITDSDTGEYIPNYELTSEQKQLISALELEPFRQAADKSTDTLQIILGYANYKCHANVYKRIDWPLLLDTKAQDMLISTLMTVYDESKNAYVQVPYVAMHLATPSSHYLRVCRALSYKETFYPALRPTPPPATDSNRHSVYTEPSSHVYDNKGRECLICDYGASDFGVDTKKHSTFANYDRALIAGIELANGSYCDGSKIGSIEILNDNGTAQQYDVTSFTRPDLALYNPGVVFPFCTYKYRGVVRRDDNSGTTSNVRYNYEIKRGAPFNYIRNPAITADLFRLYSNMGELVAEQDAIGFSNINVTKDRFAYKVLIPADNDEMS